MTSFQDWIPAESSSLQLNDSRSQHDQGSGARAAFSGIPGARDSHFHSSWIMKSEAGIHLIL